MIYSINIDDKLLDTMNAKMDAEKSTPEQFIKSVIESMLIEQYKASIIANLYTVDFNSLKTFDDSMKEAGLNITEKIVNGKNVFEKFPIPK